MKLVIKKAFHLVFILVFALAFASCKSDSAGGGTAPSIGGGDGGDGGGGDDTDPVDDTPVGEVETSGFWVNIVTRDQFDVYVKKRNLWGEKCFISKDTTTNESIECIVDIMEQDLYMVDLEVQYNAPPGLCSHVAIRPAWSWNFSAGIGPREIQIERDTSVVPTTLTSCLASAEPALETQVEGMVGDGFINCAQHPELEMTNGGLDVRCVYDYTNNGGPGCCFGPSTRTITDDDGVTQTQTVTDFSWGGDIKSCAATTLQTTWEFFNESYPEYPQGMVQKVPRDPKSTNPTGLNDSILLLSNLMNQNVWNSVWANWFEAPGAANGHTHNGFFSATVSDLPYAVDPIDDLSGDQFVQFTSTVNPLRRGREQWTFECLDAGGEINHRIDLYIREWNTLADFVAYGASESVTYDPDVTGIEGTNCNYDPIFSYDGCNDFSDMDDILDFAGGAYGTTPGVNTNTDRALYFNRVSN